MVINLQTFRAMYALCAGAKESRQYLQGVIIAPDNGSSIYIGTDAHVLGVAEGVDRATDEPISVIPLSTLPKSGTGDLDLEKEELRIVNKGKETRIPVSILPVKPYIVERAKSLIRGESKPHNPEILLISTEQWKKWLACLSALDIDTFEMRTTENNMIQIWPDPKYQIKAVLTLVEPV